MESLFTRIKNRLIRDFNRARFNAAARKILTTAPLRPGKESFMILSMVHHRDVIAYLLAVKSFAHQTDPARIVVVCDPSLDQDDQDVIRAHIPHIEFRAADEFTNPDTPRGGTWERLYAISEYAQNNYVIQLDADTLTLSAVPEVLAAIRARHGFVIGEKIGQTLVTLEEAEAYARPWQQCSYVSIQALSEVLMVEADLPHNLYVRGCSGFTGFAPYPAMRENLLAFSRAMRTCTKERWSEWGTEQITSNYLIANAPGTALLPYPKYSTPDEFESGPAFQHFIGYMRFVNGNYAVAARRVLKLLANKG